VWTLQKHKHLLFCGHKNNVVNKKAAQKFEGERFNLRKLKELEVKEKYQIEITNRFAALENLDVDEDVIGLGKTLKRISKPQLKRA